MNPAFETTSVNAYKSFAGSIDKRGEASKQKNRKNKTKLADLHEFFVPVEIHGNSDVDGYYGQQNAGQRNRRKFINEFYSDEDNQTHNHEQHCSVDAKIIIHDTGIFCEITENGYRWCHVSLETDYFDYTDAGFLVKSTDEFDQHLLSQFQRHR